MELEEHSLGAGQMMAFAAELVRVRVSAACSASPAWICAAELKHKADMESGTQFSNITRRIIKHPLVGKRPTLENPGVCKKTDPAWISQHPELSQQPKPNDFFRFKIKQEILKGKTCGIQ